MFNDNFNKITNKKEERIIIKELWNFTYEELRSRIWIPRCEEISRLEKIEGIQKQDLKKKRKMIKITGIKKEKLEKQMKKIKELKKIIIKILT